MQRANRHQVAGRDVWPASKRQAEVWAVEKAAQTAAFAAAQVCATCESVDAAARRVITNAGFGPDYEVPGLPHRTGHGIGITPQSPSIEQPFHTA